MPKAKTRKSISKRFKITKNGKIMRGHHGSRHRMSHKAKRRRRTFAEPLMLNKKQTNIIKPLIKT